MIRLRALGGLELEPTKFTQPKPLLLLAYLALEGAQQRRHLAELFWPEGQRMKSLSMALTRLRQGAGPVVEADDRRVWTTIASDVKALLETLDKSQWRRAADLYTGAFLEGVVLDWESELEEWVYATREYLAGRVQYALLQLAEEAARKRDFQAAASLAARAYRLPGLAASEPERLEPLYRLLAAGQSPLAAEVRKEAASYGLQLKLTTTEAQAAFEAAATTPHNLILKGTSFVGRDLELTEIATLLAKPSCRLLTLTGPGGSGKTRLAMQVAHEQLKLGSYPGGVYMVVLEGLTQVEQLFAKLMQALGLELAGQEAPLARIARAIGDKRVLLVLDNFEQLLGKAAGRSVDLARLQADGVGARADDATFVLSALLQACPHVKLVVTSRERLNLEEEYLVPIEGLPYPEGAAPRWEEAETSDAVQLFVQRAEQAEPQFNLTLEALPDVSRICRLVAGMPLGLELAASWVRFMPCAEIAEEIARNLDFLAASTRNVPERQRSLRAVFESSWQQLSPKEQQALRRLSVFRGGFRREAAAEVAGATLPLLASLVGKSLLRVVPSGRYDRHPLLYQYMQEKLAADPRELSEAKARHAAFYLAFAEEAGARLHGREQVYWFERLGQELENFRVAFDALADEPLRALQLAAALGYFWEVRGYYREGYETVSRLLRRVSVVNELTAKVSLVAAQLAWRQGEHRVARRWYSESLAQAEKLAQGAIQIEAHCGLGLVAKVNLGEFEAAHAHFQRALELAREREDKALVAQSLRFLGALYVDNSRYQEARRCYEESAQLHAELGDAHGRAKSLLNLATVLTYLGELDEAHRLNLESLALLRAVGDSYGEGVSLLNLGMDAAAKGERLAAIRLYQESLALFKALGDERMISHLLNNLAGEYQKLVEPHKARALLEESLTIQRRIGDVTLISHALYLLGQVHDALGEGEEAYRRYQECIALCRKNSENWALMRVLEVLAGWHLKRQDYPAAEAALEEARALAEAAGDRRTMTKVGETQARLEAAQRAASSTLRKKGPPKALG